jgi:hypothetical protein
MKMAKENKPTMRNRKGWKGYVWNYPDWQRKVVEGSLWDDIRLYRNGKGSM